MISNNSFSYTKWGYFRVFFEEVVEIGGVFETETIADLGDGPVAMEEQCAGFFDDAVRDVLGGGPARGVFDRAIEVVDMYSKALRVRGGGLQLHRMVMAVYGELPFQQFQE